MMVNCVLEQFNSIAAKTEGSLQWLSAFAGLIDEAGGSKQLVLGVDDKLLECSPRNIPRADVAALAVGCIGLPHAINRSFDVLAVAPTDGEQVNNSYSKLLSEFEGNSDYGINSQA
jgi:hypothetical protein